MNPLPKHDPQLTIDRANTFFLFIVCAFVYPAWGYVAARIAGEESGDVSLWGRLGLSMICLLGAGLARQPRLPSPILYRYFQCTAYLLTANMLWLMHQSGMSGHYQAATLLIVCCAVATFPQMAAVRFYLGSVFLTSLFLFAASSYSYPSLGWLALMATAIAVMIPTLQVRERLIQDLRYSKAGLALFFENASVGISHVDSSGRFQTVNPCFADYLGYSKAELESRTLIEVTPQEERDSRERLFRAFIDSDQQTLKADRPYIRKDGSEVWLRLLMRRLDAESHGVNGTIAAAVDVTLERQHLRRHEHFRTALLMIAHGEETALVLQHIGESLRADLSSLDACEIYEQREGEARLLLQVARQARAEDANRVWSEPLMSRSNSALGQVDVYVRGAFSLSGEELAILKEYASLLSVALESRTRDAQIAKQQYQIVSSEKMASLGVLAAGLAHEISNPTAVIEARSQQIVEMLADPMSNHARVIELCKIISRMSTRILKIVHGVRTLSRNSESDGMLPASLRSIMDDTMTLCSEPIFDNGIEVDWGVVPESLTLECRETQIAQVLLNLLRNACEAVKDLEQRWIKVSVEQSETYLSISVTDSGKGVDPELAGRLFQAFFTTKDVGKGTGLGLSISADIARDHGGSLRLDPDCPNTRFILEIPLKQEVGRLSVAV